MIFVLIFQTDPPESKAAEAITHPEQLPTQDPSVPAPSPRLRQNVPSDISNQERPFTNMIDKLIEDERSRTTNQEFQPLQPDTETTDAESNSGRVEPMTDEQFVQYYKQLSPFERKRQLQVQKKALLEEQTYLKSLLVQQEKLLQAKQEQLHMQHELQQERLRYFERTGNFPPHDPRIKLPILETEPYPLRNIGNYHLNGQKGHVSQTMDQNVGPLTNGKTDQNVQLQHAADWKTEQSARPQPRGEQNVGLQHGMGWPRTEVPPTPLEGPFPSTPDTVEVIPGRPKPVFYPPQGEEFVFKEMSLL